MHYFTVFFFAVYIHVKRLDNSLFLIYRSVMDFQLLSTDGYARRGRLTFSRGVI